MPIPFTSLAPCTHEGACAVGLCPSICGLVQLAQSLKYSVNHTWQFAEIAEGIFALYNPIRRELAHLGSIDECLAIYRARERFIPVRREELVSRPRPTSRFQNVVVNI